MARRAAPSCASSCLAVEAHEYSLPPSMPSRCADSLLRRCCWRSPSAAASSSPATSIRSRAARARSRRRVVSGSGDAKILLMDISGVITSEERAGPLGPRQQREHGGARRRPSSTSPPRTTTSVAIVVRINSPGGTVTASDIIYERLMRFKAEHDVPVLVQMMDVAASGGYYVGARRRRDHRQPDDGDRQHRRDLHQHQRRRPDGQDRRARSDRRLGRDEGHRLAAAHHDAGRARGARGADRRHAGALRRPGARAPAEPDAGDEHDDDRRSRVQRRSGAAGRPGRRHRLPRRHHRARQAARRRERGDA